jgi:hypothetical protein
LPIPKESTTPTVTIERIAVRVLPAILDIFSPSCAARAFKINYPKSREVRAVAALSRLSLASAPGFEGSARLQLK